MALRNVILVLGLNERYSCGIQIFARKRSLIEKHLPAFKHFLRGVECLLRVLHIEFGLLRVFRKRGANAGFVGRLGLFVGSLVIQRGRGKVTALKLGQQLALPDLLPAHHVELLHRRADLGHDQRLDFGKDDCLSAHHARDVGFLCDGCLHGNRSLSRFFTALAACCTESSHNPGDDPQSSG